MNKKKSIILWILSFLLMCGVAIYQRMTGPTYPIKSSISINNEKIKYELPRTHGGEGSEKIAIKVSKNIKGKIILKRFKSYDRWLTKDMDYKNGELIAAIPHQPPAGKVIYSISLYDENNKKFNLTEEPVIIRFKGDVPTYFIIPHVIFLFLAMWFSTRTGLEALYKGQNVFKLTILTCIFLGIGGMLLGPVIQESAFGALWTGWPFGHDLTDNKTLIAFIMWLIAFLRLQRNPNNIKWAIIASCVLLIIFLIPHSVLGSELDYTQFPEKSEFME